MSTSKRVVVTGATGLVGKALCGQLVAQGYEITVFSRNPEKARQSVAVATEYIAWSPSEMGDWAQALEGAYGVIHLAGAPIFGKRWNDEYKAAIRDSRVESTRNLVAAMEKLDQKPQVFVCGSAVGYYGDTGDTQVDESAAAGNDFLAQVCVEWEQVAAKAEDLGIRTVMVRTGIVLDAKDGALPLMVLPFQWYAGGPILPGTQWFPWIHVADEVGIIMLALEHDAVRGPINATAPNPQPNQTFMKTLGTVMGTPSWLPVPGFGLKIMLGELADQLVSGQRALPAKAQEHGYEFRYPASEQALRNLLKK